MHRIAMISVHTCPMAALGGKETGGMNVYVRELSRELAAQDLLVDIYTRSQDASRERVRQLWQNVRVIHLPAGPEKPYDKNLVYQHLPQFVAGFREFCTAENITYDLLHSHYWLSGWVSRELKRLQAVPTVHMFHTLGRMKNMAARDDAAKETATGSPCCGNPARQVANGRALPSPSRPGCGHTLGRGPRYVPAHTACRRPGSGRH
jgi:D-inositol-3-phosphate glycosyltransferase